MLALEARDNTFPFAKSETFPIGRNSRTLKRAFSAHRVGIPIPRPLPYAFMKRAFGATAFIFGVANEFIAQYP
jgi:hypothetical protein